MNIERDLAARRGERPAMSPTVAARLSRMSSARRILVRILPTLLAFAGSSAIGLMLPADARAQPGAYEALPVLPAATEVVVLGEGVRLFGAPARMAVFRSAHDASDLLDYIAARHPEFNQLHIEPQRITLAAIGGLCTKSISVAQADTGGSVGSVASVCGASAQGPSDTTRLRADKDGKGGTADFGLPSSELLLDVSFTEDEQEVRQQVWASPLSARHLDQAFRRRLAAQGWQGGEPAEGATGRDGLTSEARLAQHWRPGETLAYVITPTAAGGAGASGLWLRHTRPADSQPEAWHSASSPIRAPVAGEKP